MGKAYEPLTRFKIAFLTEEPLVCFSFWVYIYIVQLTANRQQCFPQWARPQGATWPIKKINIFIYARGWKQLNHFIK